MAEHSSIEWTGATLNVVTGCTRVSEGCDHCYIERTPPFRMAGRRFDKPGIGGTTGVQLHADRLNLPLKWREPQRIFVNSLSDLFHDDVPDTFLDEVFGMMAVAHRVRGHVFQVLTKRPARMRSYLNQAVRSLSGGYIGSTRQAIANAAHRWAIDKTNAGALSDEIESGAGWPVPGVWLGASVENQKWAGIRIPLLREVPAVVRFLSCEPQLGPLTGLDLRGIGWLIAGGESGPGARPMHPDWPLSLLRQCRAAGVPYFFKQWGEYGPLPRLREDGRVVLGHDVTVAYDGTVYQPGDLCYPDGPRYGDAIRARHAGRLHTMYRVGKKVAGRELDDREWNEYPQAVAA